MLPPKTNTHDRLFFIIHLMLSVQGFLAEQSQLICSRQPIVALAGDDVILPCHLQPPIDADSETVIWTRPGLDPKYIHHHEDGRLNFRNQNPSYYYRTRLFVDELKNGNVSMKIFTVKLSDTGEYKCFLRSMMKEASIQLTVGAVSDPNILDYSIKTGEVVLVCEAKGWYPEPEVFWLDGEGNLLSAGPTETVRGPDDLYTVRRRLYVEKSDNFTCRVQQKNIKQTRETHFYVPEDFFTVQSSFSQTQIIIIITNITIIIILVVLLVIIVTLICFSTNRRQAKEEKEKKKLNRTVEETERADQQRELQEEMMTEQGLNENDRNEEENK